MEGTIPIPLYRNELSVTTYNQFGKYCVMGNERGGGLWAFTFFEYSGNAKKKLFLFEPLKKHDMFHFLFLCDGHFRRIPGRNERD